MNPILLTKDFTLPEDGWFQIAPQGEYPHASTGLCQVLDDDACRAIVAAFTEQAAAPNFGGALVDYDHFSFDTDKSSEAAGWIVALEHRPGSGLWARIRWTDTGEASVRGGRYRFISPVWKRDDCQIIANGRIRPLRLTNAALTNSPNIVGMAPLTNSARLSEDAAAVLKNRVMERVLNPGGAAPTARPLNLSPLSNVLRTLRNRSPMTRQQEVAMFAKAGRTYRAAKASTSKAQAEYQAETKRQEAATAAAQRARLNQATGQAKAAAAATSSNNPAPWTDAASHRASLGLGPKGNVVTGGSKKAVPSIKKPSGQSSGGQHGAADDSSNPRPAIDPAIPLEKRIRDLDAKIKSDIENHGHANFGSNRLDAVALAQEILGPASDHDKRSAGKHSGSMSAAGAVAQTYSDKLNKIVNGILSGRGLGDLLSTLRNRSPMSDDQRRAMFAKMKGSGGAGVSFRTGSTSTAATPPRSTFVRPDTGPTSSPAEALYHSTTFRDHDARIDQLRTMRDRVATNLPSEPERRSFETVDPRALQTQLLREGKPLNDVTTAVREATQNNARVKAELAALEDSLLRRGVSKARLASEMAKELDRIAKDDDKARADWEKTVAAGEKQVADYDRRIAEEEIRRDEAVTAENQRRWNAAVKEAVAGDKVRAAELAKAEATRKKAEDDEAAAAKKAQDAAAKAAAAATADPIKENTVIKARNKAYTEAIYRGDMALAERLAPGVDHQKNAEALTARLPSALERTSPRNLKVLAELVKTFETINPHAWPQP